MTLTRQHHAYTAATGPVKETNEFVTIGFVVDTNDPQQMGRIRAVCPTWGDSYGTPINDLPWALYITPFGGQTTVGTRGAGIQSSEGGIAYGMWAIPKVGAQVLIMCVDGDPQHRVYLGCMYDQFTPHTMPHGRWKYDDHPALEKSSSSSKPYGPYTSREGFIEPLAENLREAFAFKNEPNFEWRTRAADYQAAAIDVSHLNGVYGDAADDKQVKESGWVSTQGYQISRTDPQAPTSVTDKNYDNMVYSWTSPGFHSMSMDDRQENCRVRFRTTGGHQIILDDTNERIYIQTAQGRNWIEMDQAGNIDVFTTNKVNIRSRKDINLTSDASIRMHAKKGIHMYSGEEIRMHAMSDIHTRTPANIRTNAGSSIYTQAAANIHIKSGSNVNITAGATANIYAAGDIIETGSNIHLNGPVAETAAAPSEQPALWTNRVPDHEPWARTMTKDDTTHAPELAYTDKRVGKVERGIEIDRGMFWRR
jgi:phage baseplate assembly protein gpV